MTPHYADDHLTIHLGDVRDVLAAMEPESVGCVVTSPPYFSLRDYGIPPSVWGGDPGHEHEWTETEKRAEKSASVHWQHTEGGGTRPDGSFRNRHANAGEDADAHREYAAATTGHCSCGAWLGCLGLEPTPELYVEHMVAVFREVRRVLRKDGTLWLNLGDSYATGGGAHDGRSDNQRGVGAARVRAAGAGDAGPRVPPAGYKAKDRMMIPARVAIALQEDGWWLRDEIVWAKPNPMPSSVRDRTTPAHEMVYLLSKSARYHFDAAAIAEPGSTTRPELLAFGERTDVGLPDGRTHDRRRQKVPGGWDIAPGSHGTVHRGGRTEATYRERNVGGRADGFTQMPGDASEWAEQGVSTRNKRSVWTVATEPYPEAHFATFPQALIEPMILAGCREGDTVLDPFGGSGTVAVVAQRLGRKAVLIDRSAEYVGQMIRRVGKARAQGQGPAVDMPVPLAADGLWA